MKKIILILMLVSPIFAEDWKIVPSEKTHCKLYYSAKLKTSKWTGIPDPNYSWDGARLSYERNVKDENGKEKTVKTYREPIEIIANFKSKTKVFGVDNKGGIERAAVRKFGGALTGFVWLDNISGGGEVTLPFTAPHIFIARGNRLNPELTEIFTDPNEDNYYEVVEGKTRVFLKSFSGVGGAASSPATWIAWYKMNENTASDNDELVTNGTFAAWVGDDPTGWTVVGESGNDPEISEAATGEAHADTPTAGGGMCNLYTSDGTYVSIFQSITTLTSGRKYQVSITVNTITAGEISISDTVNTMFAEVITSTGTRSFVFVATDSTISLQIKRRLSVHTDVTFDDVSIKLCAAEDSSVNDHDGLLQEDTDAAHVTGKTDGAFDFDGSSDYIEIDDHADFTPALTPLSISVWVNMHDATDFIIASKGIYNTDGEWRFFLSAADKIIVNQFDESVANCYIGRKYNTAVTAYEDQWIHLVMTSDGGTLSSGNKIYLNGVQVDDTDDENGTFVAVENLTHAVWIGRYDTTYSDGLIDNVIFFSTDLSQEEIEGLYNDGAGTEIIAEIDERRARSRRRY